MGSTELTVHSAEQLEHPTPPVQRVIERALAWGLTQSTGRAARFAAALYRHLGWPGFYGIL